jgi:predicted ATP-grasp superfamily ATP-dependent carboligase
VTAAGPRPAVVFGLLHAGLAVARSLGRGGVPVTGIALDRREFGLRSRYVRRRYVIEGGDEAERDRRLLAALLDAGTGRRAVLFPECDRQLDFVLRNWDAVARLALVPLPSDPDVVRRLASKEQLVGFAAAAGIPVPATVVARDEDDVRGADLRPPVLVKPAAGEEFARTFGVKAFLTRDVRELVAAWRCARDAGFDTVLQELVPGADDQVFSLFTYVGRSGLPLASVVGRKVRQAPLRLGTSSVFEVVRADDVLEFGHTLLACAGFLGLAHVELVRDPRDGGLRLLEVNPRPPVWAAIATTGRLDLIRVAYDDLCGLEVPAGRLLEEELTWIYLAKDAWVGRELARRGELRPRSFLAAYARRGKVRATLARDDLRPALASLPYLRARARGYAAAGLGGPAAGQRVPSAFSQTSGAPDER